MADFESPPMPNVALISACDFCAVANCSIAVAARVATSAWIEYSSFSCLTAEVMETKPFSASDVASAVSPNFR
ncbi:hypothetical protein [Bradyrhizobium embrapense]|uniref:hypothetical protein n=1 Tax=Bradyrhizobium embrapense TaxID=630921 RepID=UPI001560EA7A|nr:hypothetical protein [Bradyrhizobium embrapense]